MKVYNLALSTNFTSNTIASLIDKTNLSRVKWFINWQQFFKYEDFGKRCNVKIVLYSNKSSSTEYDNNLGFLTATLPSGNVNFINGAPLGLVTAFFNVFPTIYQFNGSMTAANPSVLTCSTNTVQLPNGTVVSGYGIPIGTTIVAQTGPTTYTTSVNLGVAVAAEAMTGIFGNSYVYCDTTLQSGLECFVPDSAAEFALTFIKNDGTQMTNIPNYVCDIIFEIDD